jgi:clan AA aspartic protease
MALRTTSPNPASAVATPDLNSDDHPSPEITSSEGETKLGEVRVRVKLSNAVDQALVRRGLLSLDQVRHYEASALIDTGAVRCVLPPHIVERLGLDLVGKRVAEYADGRLEAVGLTEPFNLQIEDREELETAMVLGDEVLIGQTALEKMDLLVDCVNQRLVPNPAHPDQPVSKVK